MMPPCLFAQGGQKCQDVGGAVLTNFLSEPGSITIYSSGKLVHFTGIALGTLTGDLRGSVVIYVLDPAGNYVIANMVTESGDTIYVDEAFATGGLQFLGLTYLQRSIRRASKSPAEPGASLALGET
ncbi:MAG: hypothetical protein JO159_03495 [Acidobacteria bacterium]|nr:hypothetical protein [Acidobacteriota bacterium]